MRSQIQVNEDIQKSDLKMQNYPNDKELCDFFWDIFFLFEAKNNVLQSSAGDQCKLNM